MMDGAATAAGFYLPRLTLTNARDVRHADLEDRSDSFACDSFLAQVAYVVYGLRVQSGILVQGTLSAAFQSASVSVQLLFRKCRPLKILYAVVCAYAVLVIDSRLGVWIRNELLRDHAMNLDDLGPHSYRKITIAHFSTENLADPRALLGRFSSHLSTWVYLVIGVLTACGPHGESFQ